MSDTDTDRRIEAGKRLRYAREIAGFKSQLAACEHFKWHQSSYNSHEAGVRKMNDSNATKYGLAYGADPAWIMFGKGDAPKKSNFNRLDPTQLDQAEKLQAPPILAQSVKVSEVFMPLPDGTFRIVLDRVVDHQTFMQVMALLGPKT